MLSMTIKVAVAATTIASVGAGAAWKATLQPVGESTVSGETTVTASTAPATDSTSPDQGKLVATIHLKGARDGDLLPWHVHGGTCGSANAPIVGSANDYSTITVTASGEGRATATLSVPLSPSESYIVNVHRSPTDATVISCGSLKPSSAPVDR
jgi:hypothetical protein